MDRLLKNIQQVCLAAFYSLDFFLLHDNAPAHKAASVWQFLTQKNVTTIITPHSPDLSAPDYFLFPKLKMKLKGLHFVDVAKIHNWWIKESPKWGVFSIFSETVHPCRSLYIYQWSLFWIKWLHSGDALLYVYLVGPESEFTSCSNVQGISNHRRVLLEVEWRENCCEHQVERLVPVYLKTYIREVQSFLRGKFASWAGNGSCMEEICKSFKE